ncbi:MAG: TlpA family protein disulfide reductase [Flavobacteriales bacterium]|nr:TlpA family protein disulfide reductase [Flavobacteriales bacterium]
MRPVIVPTFFLVALLLGCSGGERLSRNPRLGPWRMVLNLGDASLPFQFSFTEGDTGALSIRVSNASEIIDVPDVSVKGDSLTIRMPLFDSEFIGVLDSDSSYSGFWHNYLKGPNYRIPFTAKAGAAPRFSGTAFTGQATGRWKTVFSPGAPEAYNAIGVFEQHADGVVVGTFLTETGDYRFLEGVATADSLMLSCFDGSHAFLFKARLDGETLAGRFWSGTHWHEPWVAVKDSAFTLRNPDSLTSLREGYEMVDFDFPDTEGRTWSTSDPALHGRPLLVHIMGSWCPNCVDETRLLKEAYAKYHDRGLEVVAIGFEKYEDPQRARQALLRFKNRLQVPYPILFGGSASKDRASAKLPFLNHLISYPTCIFIGRDRRVRRIRTGFYGPGTGAHYEHYRKSLDAFLESLVAE